MIELDVPGCEAERVSVEVVDGSLVVTGERDLVTGAMRRYRSERWQGRFVRSFGVPDGVSGDQIMANYHAGVLTLRLPKPERQRPKRIAISEDRTALSSGDVIEHANA